MPFIGVAILPPDFMVGVLTFLLAGLLGSENPLSMLGLLGSENPLSMLGLPESENPLSMSEVELFGFFLSFMVFQTFG
jgi:hypothetical protein